MKLFCFLFIGLCSVQIGASTTLNLQQLLPIVQNVFHVVVKYNFDAAKQFHRLDFNDTTGAIDSYGKVLAAIENDLAQTAAQVQRGVNAFKKLENVKLPGLTEKAPKAAFLKVTNDFSELSRLYSILAPQFRNYLNSLLKSINKNSVTPNGLLKLPKHLIHTVEKIETAMAAVNKAIGNQYKLIAKDVTAMCADLRPGKKSIAGICRVITRIFTNSAPPYYAIGKTVGDLINNLKAIKSNVRRKAGGKVCFYVPLDKFKAVTTRAMQSIANAYKQLGKMDRNFAVFLKEALPKINA